MFSSWKTAKKEKKNDKKSDFILKNKNKKS